MDPLRQGSPPDRASGLLARWPASRRKRTATVIAIVAIVAATLIASSRLVRLVFPDLDVLAYLGLAVACWIGAGGALVPIPGVRPTSWFMIVQQGALLDPVIVALVGASAMTLGQTSYFLATRARGRGEPDAVQSSGDLEGSDPRPNASLEPGTPADETGDAPTERQGGRARRLARARERIARQVDEHGMATVFLVCALPTPLTTLTTTAAAISGMGYARYFPAALAGFLVLCSVLVVFGQGLLLAIRAVVPLL